MITTPFASPRSLLRPRRSPIADRQRLRPPSDAAADARRATRPSKTRRKQAIARAAGPRRSPARAARRPARGLDLTEPLLDAIRECRRITQPRGRRRQMQLHRQADAPGRRRAAARGASPSAQLGRAQDSLALHQAERWRAELIADDDARRASPRASGSRRAAAARPGPQRAQGRARWRPSSAAAAPTASCSSSSASTRSDELKRRPADAACAGRRAHRPRLDQRPRLGRRLRGQGHPGAAATGSRARCATRRLGDAPHPRRARRRSRATLSELVDDAAATWC